MKNPLDRRKNLLEEENAYISDFDYSEIDVIEKQELIEIEIAIKQNQAIFLKTTLDLGGYLYTAQAKLSKYKTGTFMNWYENLGFNKDNVSVLLKRYNLFLNHSDQKEFIGMLPNIIVKEITKKDVEPKMVEEVFEQKILDTKSFKVIKNKYSPLANNRSDVNPVDIKEVSKLIKLKLEEKLSNRDIKELAEYLLAIYKFTRKKS